MVARLVDVLIGGQVVQHEVCVVAVHGHPEGGEHQVVTELVRVRVRVRVRVSYSP